MFENKQVLSAQKRGNACLYDGSYRSFLSSLARVQLIKYTIFDLFSHEFAHL